MSSVKTDNLFWVHRDAVRLSPKKFCTYFLMSERGRIIYIGSGDEQRARDSQKAKKAASILVVWHDTREAATILERDMIESHMPPLNAELPAVPGKMKCRIWRGDYEGRSKYPVDTNPVPA